MEDDRSKPIRSSSLEDYADRRLDWPANFHQSSWDMVGSDLPLSSQTHQQSTHRQINIYKLINSVHMYIVHKYKLTSLNKSINKLSRTKSIAKKQKKKTK